MPRRAAVPYHLDMPPPRTPKDDAVDAALVGVTKAARDALAKVYEDATATYAPAKSGGSAMQRALDAYVLAAEHYIRNFSVARERGRRVERLTKAREALKALGFDFERF